MDRWTEVRLMVIKEQKKAGTKKASKEEYHTYPSRGSESRK
jgi:hypothetical protein